MGRVLPGRPGARRVARAARDARSGTNRQRWGPRGCTRDVRVRGVRVWCPGDGSHGRGDRTPRSDDDAGLLDRSLGLHHPAIDLGLELMWSGRLDEARQLFEEELAEYERHAMYTVRQEVLCYLAELECRAGRWSLSAELAAEAMDTVIESGQRRPSHVALFNQALPAVHLGRIEEARTWASEGERLAVANDDAFNASWNRGSWGSWNSRLATLNEPSRTSSRSSPTSSGWVRSSRDHPLPPDAIEALVALGRDEEAERLVDWLEERGRSRDRAWALATAFRGRALIEAARGHVEEGAEQAERALEEHARVPMPFETARTEPRRARSSGRRQKRAAMSALERAKDTFVRLGAPLWGHRAEAELTMI